MKQRQIIKFNLTFKLDHVVAHVSLIVALTGPSQMVVADAGRTSGTAVVQSNNQHESHLRYRLSLEQMDRIQGGIYTLGVHSGDNAGNLDSLSLTTSISTASGCLGWICGMNGTQRTGLALTGVSLGGIELKGSEVDLNPPADR